MRRRCVLTSQRSSSLVFRSLLLRCSSWSWLSGLLLGESGQGEAKKKKSRWELTDPGITEQVQLKLRLDDIQRKLSLADCGVSKEDPAERCVRPFPLGTPGSYQVEMNRDACR
eukprot:COSAG02_NODE_919_length_15936_cov_5.055314_26_plen_113_part_00